MTTSWTLSLAVCINDLLKKITCLSVFQGSKEESKYGNLEKWCAGLYFFSSALVPSFWWRNYETHCLMVLVSGRHSERSKWRSNALVGEKLCPLASSLPRPEWEPRCQLTPLASVVFCSGVIKKGKLGFVHHAFKGNNKNNFYHVSRTYLPFLVQGPLYSIHLYKTPVR